MNLLLIHSSKVDLDNLIQIVAHFIMIYQGKLYLEIDVIIRKEQFNLCLLMFQSEINN